MQRNNEIYANSAEYWQQKLGKFTASGVSKLFVDSKTDKTQFGVGAMTYIKEKACEVLSGKPQDVYAKSLEYGNTLEPEAVKFYEYLNNLKLKNTGDKQKFFELGKDSGGTPDGLIKKDGTFEAKCPFNRTEHLENLLFITQDDFKKYHKEYYTQIQTCLAATKRKYCDFFSFCPYMYNEKLISKTLRIERDEILIDEIQNRVERAAKIRDEIIFNVLKINL
jgi:hypothetical protein